MTQASAAAPSLALSVGGARAPFVIVDRSHCGRHVTGLERITLELFSDEALAPLNVMGVTAGGRLGMMAKQTLTLPLLAARHREALVLCPGFPPSPLLSTCGARVLPYIHDLFLITRPQDLNARAKFYMAAPFARAVKRLPRFLVNSEHTERELRRFCRPDAEICLYRPRVRNVFNLDEADRAQRGGFGDGLRLVALGTIEPRKNLRAAARIVAALREMGQTHARLDVVGRVGWGEDAEFLSRAPGVTMHGYLSAEAARAVVGEADALISTAHDEGLGLPLLEAQYAGLPVIAPDQAIFREALGRSGVFIRTQDHEGAARAILTALTRPDWRAEAVAAARANLARWNAQADGDKARTMELLTRLSARRSVQEC
jgi:glycosyltransferase involved in cell wall biosynthesis